MDLLSSIAACEAALEEQEVLMEEATSQYQASLKLHHDASESFNELGLREVDMKSKRGEIFKEQISIDNEVSWMHFYRTQLLLTLFLYCVSPLCIDPPCREGKGSTRGNTAAPK